MLTASIGVTASAAPSDLKVTQIYGSANGWNSNTNWIGFTLNQTLDLSTDGAEVALYYEYIEDGIINQLRSESTGVVYSKNKAWSGYLNSYDSTGNVTKYSTGGASTSNYSDILPADTVISSNLTNMPANYPKLTAKVQNGDVEYFRVRLVIYNEDGELANDSYTNWIKYETDLTTSVPQGLANTELPTYTDPYEGYLPDEQPKITIGNKIYTTLDVAVAAAQAGDTISLSAGTFQIYSQLVIDDSITIIGAGKEDTVIQYCCEYNGIYSTPAAVTYLATRFTNPVINATAPLVMENLTLKCGPITNHGGIDGIYTTENLSLTNVLITDIRCTGDGKEVCGVQCGRGVIADGSDVITIANSEISSFQKQAIDVNNVSNLTVTNTTITGIGDQNIIAQNGIILRGNTVAMITGNSISNLQYSADDEDDGCSVSVYVTGDSSATVSGNTIDSVNNAFYIDNNSTLKISNNTLINVVNEFEQDSIGDVLILTESLTLDKESVTLNVNETIRLNATITPSNSSDSIIWSTSDSSIATVENGVVTAKTPGTVTIKVETEDGSHKASCQVTVNAIAVTSVRLNKKADTLVSGRTLQLTATVAPSNATYKNVTWSSDNPSVATVSQNGKVTAKKAGDAVITVSANNGLISAKCAIKVKAKATKIAVKASGYTIGHTTKENTIILKKGKNVKLKATVSPSNAIQGVTYKVTKGAKYISVTSAGKVTAKKTGTAKIQITSKDGIVKKTITIKVVAKNKANKKLTVKASGLKKSTLTLKKGKAKQLNIGLTSGTTDTIKYKVVSGSKKITVNSYGVVTGKATGKAKLQIKCGKKIKTIVVNVTK